MAAEKQFETKVKKFLKSKGCWSLKYWGGASYTKSGIPDLLVSCSGRFMGIELKAPKGRPLPLQIINLRDIDRSGGYAILLYPDDYALFQDLIQYIQLEERKKAGQCYELLKSKWEHFENKLKRGE